MLTRFKGEKILVVDIESTCWESTPPPNQISEIIEIGLCWLHLDTLKPSGKRSILVAPQNSTVSPFCTQLTTLTPAQVAAGIPFANACTLLRTQLHAQQFTWASYGNYDRRQFQRQCQDENVPYPFSSNHFNVKKLYRTRHRPKRDGLASAMRNLQLPMEGTHHRGHDDAWNIARLLARLLRDDLPSHPPKQP